MMVDAKRMTPMLRILIPSLVGMNEVLIAFQEEYELSLWNRTEGITAFR